MGKLIRRTVTITMVETWTFVWTPDDNPPGHPATLIPHHSETEEEANENLQATITAAAPDLSGASEPPPTPPAPDAALDSLPGNEPNNAITSRKYKRPARHHASKKRRSQSASDQ